jgi:hypothetical protein
MPEGSHFEIRYALTRSEGVNIAVRPCLYFAGIWFESRVGTSNDLTGLYRFSSLSTSHSSTKADQYYWIIGNKPNCTGYGPLGTPIRSCDGNTRADGPRLRVAVLGAEVWTGFNRLRLRASGGLLWTRQFHKLFGNFWVAERLAASQEEIGLLELVTMYNTQNACFDAFSNRWVNSICLRKRALISRTDVFLRNIIGLHSDRENAIYKKVKLSL